MSLTFSTELALLLATAGAGRALARALVLALPASDQHFPQPPSQRLEGGVIESDAGAGGRAACVHKPQMTRGRAIRAVWCRGCARSTDLVRRVSTVRHRRLVASSIVGERETCRLYRLLYRIRRRNREICSRARSHPSRLVDLNISAITYL